LFFFFAKIVIFFFLKFIVRVFSYCSMLFQSELVYFSGIVKKAIFFFSSLRTLSWLKIKNFHIKKIARQHWRFKTKIIFSSLGGVGCVFVLSKNLKMLFF